MWMFFIAVGSMLNHMSCAQEILFPTHTAQKENDACTLSYNNVKGHCLPSTKCPDFRRIYNEAGSYKKIKCPFSSNLICCPESQVANTRGNLVEISEPENVWPRCGEVWYDHEGINLLKYYEINQTAEHLESEGFTITDHYVYQDELERYSFDNGTFQGNFSKSLKKKVFGAQPARVEVARYMAVIGSDEGSGIEWFCDGVLINWQWILTAAHCFRRTPTVVRLGEYDLSNDTPTPDEDPQDYKIQNYVLYPDYKFPGSNHDLALIKIHKPTYIRRPDINPICLPWGEKAVTPLLGEEVVLTGWGATLFGGPTASKLQEANITILDPSVCDKSYSTLNDYKRKFPSGIKEETHICAGNQITGVDACAGDSGGPIAYEDGGIYYLAGIVSAGHGCGLIEFPGLYTPIYNARHLSWIKKVAFS